MVFATDGAVGAVAVAQIVEPQASVSPGGVTAAAAPAHVGEPGVRGRARRARAEPPPAVASTTTPVSPDELVSTGDPSTHLCRLAADRLRPPSEGGVGLSAPRPAHPHDIRLLSPEMVTNLILPAGVQAKSGVSQRAIPGFFAWLRGQRYLQQEENAIWMLTPADLDGVTWERSRVLPGESVPPIRASGTHFSPSQRGEAVWPMRLAIAVAVSRDFLWYSGWRRYWKDVHAGASALVA